MSPHVSGEFVHRFAICIDESQLLFWHAFITVPSCHANGSLAGDVVDFGVAVRSTLGEINDLSQYCSGGGEEEECDALHHPPQQPHRAGTLPHRFSIGFVSQYPGKRIKLKKWKTTRSGKGKGDMSGY